MPPSDDTNTGRRSNTSSAPSAGIEDNGKPQSRSWSQHMPSWVPHFRASDVKILFRCSLAIWVAMLLIFIQPSLDEIGIATFFGAIVLFIVPPANVLTIHLLAIITLLLGMCLAWAWGLLTMKAALAARPESETSARFQELQQQAANNSQSSGLPAATEALILVYDGFMLDVRVSVVFYVMSCAFIYVMARIRCANPKFVGMQILGTIVADLFITIGPSLPSYNANLPSLLVKPGAAGIGIGAACCVLLFPQSTSYVVLDKLETLIRMGGHPITVTRQRLGSEEVDVQKAKSTRANMISLYKAVEPSVAFLPVDFSRCLWTARDVTQIHALVRELMLASLSILDFHTSAIANENKSEQWADRQRKYDSGDEEKPGSLIGQHQLLERAELVAALQNPELGATKQRTLAALQIATSDVLDAITKSTTMTANCLHEVNTRRWFNTPSPATLAGLRRELEAQRNALHVARKSSAIKTTEAILETHADKFDEDGFVKLRDQTPFDLSGIILSMVLEEGILGVGLAMENLMAYVEKLLEARTTTRVWLPNQLQYALSWAFLGGRSAPNARSSGDDFVNDLGSYSEDLSASQNQAKETYQRLLRGNLKPGSGRQRSAISRAIAGTWAWLTSPGGMYALRMVAVTIVTTIPAVIPRSAGFFYREKGLWAAVTAQTTLLVYMSDFIVAVLARALATILGGVIGLVAWYIGSGSGHGNPYGLAASTLPMIVILVSARLFLPPYCASASILAGATFCLIIGFSYDHHHASQYGLPGEGYVAFWKRLLLVLVGFVASMIVQMLPKPPSATKHVRHTLADAVRSLSDHYALLLSHWGRKNEDAGLAAVAEHISLDLAEQLLSLNAALATLPFEMSFSPFDQKLLKETQEQCQSLNQSLSRMLSLSTSLPTTLQDRLVRTSGLTDNRMVGDVMAVLSIVEQALRTGSPLPERLPTPLLRRFYEFWQTQHTSSMLSVDLIREEDYRRYCVAVSAYLKFLSTLDILVLVLKETLGECYVVDP